MQGKAALGFGFALARLVLFLKMNTMVDIQICQKTRTDH
jgi:hypothetical protein